VETAEVRERSGMSLGALSLCDRWIEEGQVREGRRRCVAVPDKLNGREPPPLREQQQAKGKRRGRRRIDPASPSALALRAICLPRDRTFGIRIRTARSPSHDGPALAATPRRESWHRGEVDDSTLLLRHGSRKLRLHQRERSWVPKCAGMSVGRDAATSIDRSGRP
jgi:hypothetical protein